MNMYQRLRDIREDKELDQSDVARVLGSTQQQVSKYETGQQTMGADKYLKLAKFYNISLDYLMGAIDTPRPLYEEDVPLPPAKQKRLLKAYCANPQAQGAVNVLLSLEESDK